jgi:hypothetical protein
VLRFGQGKEMFLLAPSQWNSKHTNEISHFLFLETLRVYAAKASQHFQTKS